MLGLSIKSKNKRRKKRFENNVCTSRDCTLPVEEIKSTLLSEEMKFIFRWPLLYYNHEPSVKITYSKLDRNRNTITPTNTIAKSIVLPNDQRTISTYVLIKYSLYTNIIYNYIFCLYRYT